jgi:Histidine kinase-, DNA gyrase B-, and HSP90-like ATPase
MTSIYLRKFIAEHYRGGIAARDVVREALTNSIQAGATAITVDLTFSEKQQDFFRGEQRNALEKIEISDDGDGFNDDNLKYFDEVCTPHKDSMGGKGVGRLSYLKFANSVEVTSQLSNHRVSFEYTPDFTLDDVVRESSTGPLKTTITLTNPREKINTHVASLINTICDDLRLLLFLRAQKGQNVRISFCHNSTQLFDKNYEITGESIVPIISRPLIIDDVEFQTYLFRDPPSRKGVVAMLCADDICAEEYVISKRFDICRYVLSVTSEYFNLRSNIERQRIELPKNDDEADMVSPLSRQRVLSAIHRHCLELIDEVGEGEVAEFKTQNIERLRTYYPFIDIRSLGGEAALLDAEEVIRDYRAQQARNEDRVVSILESGSQVSWDDVSHLASEDLARYIVHRALLLDSLSKLPAGAAEDAIHAAILPKGSDGSDIRSNNVWIVDDKFLAYSSVHSDKALRAIIEAVNTEAESKLGKKPDVAAFFSTDDKSDPNKLVVIEFKKPGTDVFDNNKALTQCRLYASDLSEAIPSVREVYSFAVVDVDDEFLRDLRQQEFMPVFSLSERVLYKKYSIGTDNDIPLHLYVMPASALLKDAKARNRVFEEVLQFNAARA